MSRNKKEYSKLSLILGNLVLMLWGILGTFAVWYINWVGALVFFFGVAALVYEFLRKGCCKTCYYCKTCTVGLGKLPELFFRKNGTENVAPSGLKLFPLAYAILGFVPIVAVAVSLAQGFTEIKATVLILLVVMAAYSGVIRRKLLLGKISS